MTAPARPAQSAPIPWGRCKHLFVLLNPKRCRHCGEELE